jgi:hypothetical protein
MEDHDLLLRIEGKVDNLEKCCDVVEKKIEKIEVEQGSAKNRTIATLVGVIVTLGFLALTYFR